MAVASNGTSYAWGRNTNGEFATGDTISSDYPRPTINIGTITQMKGQGDHFLAVTSDQKVWSWGANDFGQIGNGTTTEAHSPIQPTGLPATGQPPTGKMVAAGWWFSVALLTDGSVWTWGTNANGELGIGSTTTSQSTVPVKVSGIAGVAAIASGTDHVLALKSDGTVWAWGKNADGEIGDGTKTDRYVPTQVSGLTSVSYIGSSQATSYAVKSDGTVWAWGNFAALGTGSGVNATVPVQVTGVSNITEISGGNEHAIALKSDGTVWAWGYNPQGQLGDGTTTN